MDEQKKVNSVEEAEAHFAESEVAVLAVKEGEEKEVANLDEAKKFFSDVEEEEEEAA